MAGRDQCVVAAEVRSTEHAKAKARKREEAKEKKATRLRKETQIAYAVLNNLTPTFLFLPHDGLEPRVVHDGDDSVAGSSSGQ